MHNIFRLVSLLLAVLVLFPNQLNAAATKDPAKVKDCEWNSDDGHWDGECDWDDLDEAGKLAVGVIVAIIVGVIIFFAVIVVAICFCCACCCFAGRRNNKNAGVTHVHTQGGQYPQQGGAYPQQAGPSVVVYGGGQPYPQNGQYPYPPPNPGFHGNNGANAPPNPQY